MANLGNQPYNQLGRKSAELSPGSGNRKNLSAMNVQQSNKKKTGFYPEDEESEPSMYFQNQNVFRSDKEMLSSGSPSQLSSAFGSNFYGQTGMNNVTIQQRGAPFNQRNNPGHVTPTSMAPSFPMGLQQQASPNRNLMNQRGFPNANVSQAQVSQALTNIQKRTSNSMSSAILSSGTNAVTSMAGSFGLQRQGNDNQPSLDPSEFPTLGNRLGAGGGGGTPNPSFQQAQARQFDPLVNMTVGSRSSSLNNNQPPLPMPQQPQQPPTQQPQQPRSTYDPVMNAAIGGNRSQMGSNSNLANQQRPSYDTLASMAVGSSRSAIGSNSLANMGLQQRPSYVGMVSKPVQDQTPEFQIQMDEFPALPGAQIPSVLDPPSSSMGENGNKMVNALYGSRIPTNFGSYESAVNGKDGARFPGDKGNQMKRGIQTSPDGTVSNIPMGMVNDQFGMVGLLTFIRAAETDPNLVALAPGIDLTTLGLNLNSPENLYSTFQSPWAEAPCRPQDIDFHVPSEYLTNIFIREKLAPIKLNRYGEDLLFFLFYMNGGDVLQLAAAAELYNRDWRYHKEERVWITRAPGMDPLVKTNTYERGTYYFFDAQNWRKVAKEFHLEYDKLEERPHLPATLHHNPNTAMVH